jgi:hypothetical protein
MMGYIACCETMVRYGKTVDISRVKSVRREKLKVPESAKVFRKITPSALPSVRLTASWVTGNWIISFMAFRLREVLSNTECFAKYARQNSLGLP